MWHAELTSFGQPLQSVAEERPVDDIQDGLDRSPRDEFRSPGLLLDVARFAVEQKLLWAQGFPQFFRLAGKEAAGDVEEVLLKEIVVYAMVLKMTDHVGDVPLQFMLGSATMSDEKGRHKYDSIPVLAFPVGPVLYPFVQPGNYR